MEREKFKKMMKAQGHWRDGELTSAEPVSYIREDDLGSVTLIEENTGHWVDGAPSMPPTPTNSNTREAQPIATQPTQPNQDNPLKIHIFYHGEIPDNIHKNIINTLIKNPHNHVKLWVNNKARKHFANLSEEFDNVDIRDSEELKNVKSREGVKLFDNIHDIFSKIEMSDTKGKEKSLSDLSRLLALYEYGGLYLDADVALSEAFSEQELFGNSDFMTHVSIENSSVNFDFYDAIGFKKPHDIHLNEVLKNLCSDYEDGYLEAASSPGELVRIKELVRLKLNEFLTEDDIDYVLSEEMMPAHIFNSTINSINHINISETLKNKIHFSQMLSV